VPGGPDHEHVAQALIEDELGGHPAVTTAEERHGGRLTVSQAGPMRDTLAGVLGRPATNRSLPSLSAFHADTGLVLGMAFILPQAAVKPSQW